MERIRQIRVEGRTARPGNNQMQERRAGPQKLDALFGLGTWEGGCWYHSLTQGIQEEHQLRGGGGQKMSHFGPATQASGDVSTGQKVLEMKI